MSLLEIAYQLLKRMNSKQLHIVIEFMKSILKGTSK